MNLFPRCHIREVDKFENNLATVTYVCRAIAICRLRLEDGGNLDRLVSSFLGYDWKDLTLFGWRV
jgi:hypothetical protein